MIMNYMLSLYLALLNLFCTGPMHQSTSKMSRGSARIWKGTKVFPGDRPYQVQVAADDMGWCGGSLIRIDWVLTSGHCLTKGGREDTCDLAEMVIIRAGNVYVNAPNIKEATIKTKDHVFFPKGLAGSLTWDGYGRHQLRNQIEKYPKLQRLPSLIKIKNSTN